MPPLPENGPTTETTVVDLDPSPVPSANSREEGGAGELAVWMEGDNGAGGVEGEGQVRLTTASIASQLCN